MPKSNTKMLLVFFVYMNLEILSQCDSADVSALIAMVLLVARGEPGKSTQLSMASLIQSRLRI